MIIEPRHLSIVNIILQKYIPNTTVWAFGSRVHGRHLKKFSDLDLAIIDTKKTPLKAILDLKEQFVESNLPFKVDVVDFAGLDDEFKAIIQKHYEVVQNGGEPS